MAKMELFDKSYWEDGTYHVFGVMPKSIPQEGYVSQIPLRIGDYRNTYFRTFPNVKGIAMWEVLVTLPNPTYNDLLACGKFVRQYLKRYLF